MVGNLSSKPKHYVQVLSVVQVSVFYLGGELMLTADVAGTVVVKRMITIGKSQFQLQKLNICRTYWIKGCI